MKILISDKLADEGIAILKEVKEFQVDCKYNLKPEELKRIIKDYDALIVRSGTTVTADILEAASRLKVIGRAGVGLDNVDLKAATKRGVVAMNTPGGNTTSTAEHTMSLILALSRNIPQACASLKSGKWERNKFNGVELFDKSLGIVGLGRIGSTVARMAKGFGMKILAYDPFLSLEIASKMGIEMVELDYLFRNSDYITIHIPKSDETTHLITAKEIAKMKKTVRIINCARGGIIKEDDLAEALKSGRIAGCAVDVFEQEPPDPNLPLLKLENCVVTPHLGASTSEAQVNVAIEIAKTVRDALLGRGIVNAANFPSVNAEEYRVLEPYLDLSERIGKFAGQLVAGRLEEVKITYSGVVTQQKVAPLTMALVYGVLSPILGDTVNRINALDLAKERGINVQAIQSTTEQEFVNRVSAEVKTDKETFSVWGTLSNNNKPRIVKVNNIYVEALPDGYMLLVKNNDKPGFVGAVGTILGESKVNIAGITLGREAEGGEAMSLVNVDSKVPEATLEKLRKTKNILSVKFIKV